MWLTLLFSDFKILKITFRFFPHIFRDCDEGTCKDKSNILYAWARNAPPTRLPKGIGPLIWSSCVQGQGKKEDVEVRTWYIWEHPIIFLLCLIDRNSININPIMKCVMLPNILVGFCHSVGIPFWVSVGVREPEGEIIIIIYCLFLCSIILAFPTICY